MRISIISPIFGVNTGGAASYYNLLCSFLEQNSIIESVHIISETENRNTAYCNENFTKIKYIGGFPSRASSTKFGLKYLLLLFIQNVCFLKLLFSNKMRDSDIILVHTSFLNLPNFLVLSLLLFRRKIVFDVRDTQLPWYLKFQLRLSKYVIGCSDNVSEHLKKNKLHVHYLNSKVPIDVKSLRKVASNYKFSEQEANEVQHIAVVGLVKAGKGVHRVLEAFTRLSPGQFRLHVVGVIKDQALVALYQEIEGIQFYGGLCHEETISLMSKVDVVVSASKSEGMPRSLLEALCVGTEIIPPECVLEFNVYEKNFRILDNDQPLCIARKIENALRVNRKTIYDIAAHDHVQVFSRYIDFFKSSINAQKRAKKSQ